MAEGNPSTDVSSFLARQAARAKALDMWIDVIHAPWSELAVTVRDQQTAPPRA